jgi:hypothetical protein
MTKTDSRSGTSATKASGNVVKLSKQSKRDAPADAAEFVREHPLLVVAGGIALGAVAAALLPKGTTRRLARRAAGLAEVASAAGMLFGRRVRDAAAAGGSDLRERGEAMADRLERFGETASDRIDQLGGAASTRMGKLIDPVESAAATVVRKAAELRSRARR